MSIYQKTELLLAATGKTAYAPLKKSPWLLLPLGPCNIGLLGEFLRAEATYCGSWFKRFLNTPEETLMHGCCMALKKNDSLVSITRIIPLDGEPADAAFTVDIGVLRQFIDEWCALVQARPPYILVEYKGGRAYVTGREYPTLEALQDAMEECACPEEERT